MPKLLSEHPRRAIIIIAVVLILGIGTKQFFLSSKSSVQYQTATVTKGTIISTVSESGTISTGGQTNISSPTNGVIEEIYVKNGDLVTEGENLFKVKSTATEKEKQAANASYLSALASYQSAVQSKQALQATLETARKAAIDAQDAVDTMNNNRNNGANNPATKLPYTQNEIDSINSTLTSAHESFTATETKYTQADTSINAAAVNENSALLAYQETQDSVVTSPIAGTVANFSDTVGANVSGSQTTTTTSGSGSSSTSTSSGTTVLIIGNFSQLYITAAVSQVDIASVKPGQKATITLDAFSDKTFVGTVASVDDIGASTSGVVTYNAYVTFLSPPPSIKSGMTATVVIETARKDNVFTVPTTAIQTTDGTSTVNVLKNGKVSQVTVETGIASDTDTEITSGLSEGDMVVTSTLSTTPSTTTGQSASPFGSSLGGRGAGGFGGGAVRVGGGGRGN